MKIKRSTRSHAVIPILERPVASEGSQVAFYDASHELYDLAITEIEKSAETYKRYDRRGTRVTPKLHSTFERKA